MKKLLFALPLLLLFACNQQNTVKIEGKIDDADGKMLYLDRLHTASAETIDSVKLDQDGEFKFKMKTTQPEFYLLRLSNGKFITLLTTPSEEISLNSNAGYMSQAYLVSGSTGSMFVKDLNDKLRTTKDSLQAIKKEMKRKKTDPNFSIIAKKLTSKYTKIIKDQRDFSANFIIKNATSLSSYLALYQKIDNKTYTLNKNSDIKYAKVVASSMKALYPEHEYTKAVLTNLKALESQLNNLKIKKLIEENGTNYPDLLIKNTKGNEVRLSSLDGKFIVLSFWASQDINSRKQNSTLKKLYKKYRSKGLEIYQVSVDQDEKLWKTAIKEDGLNWINVCDIESGSGLAVRNFNVQQIPGNYLISKEGDIVGKNLYGSTLEEKVAEYIN